MGRLRLHAAEGNAEGAGARQGSEGAGGARHLQEARRRRRRTAEGLAELLYEEKAKAEKRLADLRAANAPADQVRAAEDAEGGPAEAARTRWTADKNAAAARSTAAAARHGVSRRDRAGARHRAQELPRPHLLPDGRHRGAAAHPDALLHDAERAMRASR